MEAETMEATMTKNRRPTVEKVEIVTLTDTDPDLSWLGEYGSEEKEGAIDREAEGDMQDKREYRYFYPPLWNYEGVPKKEAQKYARQDYKRMETYNRQEWYMMGVRAVATVSIPAGGNHSI